MHKFNMRIISTTSFLNNAVVAVTIVGTLLIGSAWCQLDMICSVDSDCAGIGNAVCLRSSPTCNNGRCSCAPGYRRVNSVCMKIVNLGDSCSATTDVCYGEHMTCTQGQCQCNYGYKGPGPKGNDCVPNLATGKLGELCYDDAACYYSLYCSNNKCQCRPGFKPNSPNNIDCVPKAPGDSCSDASDCMTVPNSHCENGRCLCDSGYKSVTYSTDLGVQYACIASYEPQVGLNAACTATVLASNNRLCLPEFKCIQCPESAYYRCVAPYPKLISGASSLTSRSLRILLPIISVAMAVPVLFSALY